MRKQESTFYNFTFYILNPQIKYQKLNANILLWLMNFSETIGFTWDMVLYWWGLENEIQLFNITLMNDEKSLQDAVYKLDLMK